MQMFDYKVLPYKTDGGNYLSTMEADLQRLGEDGWELVSACVETDTFRKGDTMTGGANQYVLFLKRGVKK